MQGINIKHWAINVATASHVIVTFSNGPNANNVVKDTLTAITPKFKSISFNVFPLDFSKDINVEFNVVIIKIII